MTARVKAITAIIWSGIAGLMTLGHPVALLVSYFLCLALGADQVVGTNVTQIDRGVFLGLLVGIGSARWSWFWRHSGRRGLAPAFRGFALANLPALPGLGVGLLLLAPVEGNAFGFFLFPVLVILTVLSTPLIWFLSIRQRAALNRDAGLADPGMGSGEGRRP